MTPVASATLLLMASNVFMTFAWYALVFRSPGTS
jgi:uncharacterized protein (DUF486 family)